METSSCRFATTACMQGDFYQYSHLYQSLGNAGTHSRDIAQPLICRVDNPSLPNSPNTYSTDSPTDSLLMIGALPPQQISSTIPPASCRLNSTSQFLPFSTLTPQLEYTRPYVDPLYYFTPPQVLSTDDFRLPHRFSQLIGSQSPVSPWATQLHSFYTSESSKIQTEFHSALSRIYTAQTPQLEPLVTGFHREQLSSLNERVSQSVSLLENYHAQPHQSGSASINPACMYNEPIGSTPASTRRRRPIPLSQLKEAHSVLDNWFRSNIDNPYPSRQQIDMLCAQSDLSSYQVKKWFCNKRSRTSNTRPFVEIMKLRRQVKRQRLDSQAPY